MLPEGFSAIVGIPLLLDDSALLPPLAITSSTPPPLLDGVFLFTVLVVCESWTGTCTMLDATTEAEVH